MSESFQILRRHFFRRFFDNDTLAVEGDTTTTVVRALSFTAAPGLMVAFFLQTEYAAPGGREKWAEVGDHYFFVLVSMVTLGLVAVFAWEMLFPDRLDFLVLTPLPVRPRTMLLAKSVALAQYLGLFLVSANVFSTLLLPLIFRPPLSGWEKLHHAMVHEAAGVMAGSFAALLVLAVGGALLCVLGARTFRRVSALVQMGLVLGSTLLLFLEPLVTHFMRQIAERPEWTRWLPSMWFLGMYERMLQGNAAPVWVYPPAREGWRALGLVAAVAVGTYPLAWARKRRMAIENTAGRGLKRIGLVAAALFYAGAKKPEERAVFAFIGQTLARNQRYQVYLAMYAGAGLALASACVMNFRVGPGALRVGASQEGLHSVMPLLLFWLVMGMRMAFAFPVDLQAVWVFTTSSVVMERCVAAAHKWVLLCGWLAAWVIALGLAIAGWSAWQVAVQTVLGMSLVLVLSDAFFAFRRGAPFTRARMPGKSSLPLMLAMYLGVFPALVTMLAESSMRMERTHRGLWVLPTVAVVVHMLCRRQLRRTTYWDAEDEMEGTLMLGLADQ